MHSVSIYDSAIDPGASQTSGRRYKMLLLLTKNIKKADCGPER